MRFESYILKSTNAPNSILHPLHDLYQNFFKIFSASMIACSTSVTWAVNRNVIKTKYDIWVNTYIKTNVVLLLIAQSFHFNLCHWWDLFIVHRNNCLTVPSQLVSSVTRNTVQTKVLLWLCFPVLEYVMVVKADWVIIRNVILIIVILQ